MATTIPLQIQLFSLLHLHSPSPSPKLSLFFPKPAASSSSSLRCLPRPVDVDSAAAPCVRTYENDLARLTVVGAVDFNQALIAAAADGGTTADEYLDANEDKMVVETLFPGTAGPNSTVSTRLILPTATVKQKSRMLRRHLTKEDLSITNSPNILALSFRKVVVRQLWNFELVLFKPGSERDMKNLESPREVPVSFTVSSSDEGIIFSLAEVVCLFALDTIQKNFRGESVTSVPNSFFRWLSKTKTISSKDSSVSMHVNEDEVLDNARNLLQKFRSLQENYQIQNKQSADWLASPLWTKMEKIGGSDYGRWTAEFVPSYQLQVNAARYSGAKFEGWKEANGNKLEVLLTHSQMVGLADILDMFLEDIYTLPDKPLSCVMLENVRKLTNDKLIQKGYSFWGLLSTAIGSAVIFVAMAVLWQLSARQFLSSRQRHPWNSPIATEATSALHISPGTSQEILRDISQETSMETSLEISQETTKNQLEAFCTAILTKIKDAYGWDGDIRSDSLIGMWTGELPSYFRTSHEVEGSHQGELGGLASENEEVKQPSLDIASYQVVLSLEGKIVGFQPTSGVAVNQWAGQPLTRELYEGKQLSPGLFEPRLKISQPAGVIVVELLMSVNSDACFALARPALDLSQ